jgi:uncharacterized protein YbaR (Trm112 family)/SAM-dependent methyltransferase
MRYSLLNFVVCPSCHSDLTAVGCREAACETDPILLSSCARVSAGSGGVGPVPAWPRTSRLTELLDKYATAPAVPDRDFSVAVEQGLLACGACGRWYPIIGFIPELLPDHLRNWDRDRAFQGGLLAQLPGDLAECLSGFQPDERPDAKQADHNKLAEIALPKKVDAAFFGPGYSAPFNPWTPEHTWHLIRNFAVIEPLLLARRGDAVLDMGCGYSWTTEWLLRGGYEAIGFDIGREYLEIAIRRMGANRPHLFVADVENLPIREDSIHAAFAFEAFHHIPNRRQAMRELGRALKVGGSFVLAEPGGEHEHSAESDDAMKRYGTLEVGMELDDVRGYIQGTALTRARKHLILRFTENETAACVPNHIFTMTKGTGAAPAAS